ncbi:MAG: response regulator transcription factor [Actinomycetota bacterium]|nr:response regulator transcription factor [Actinomycetota bacterium]
MVDDDEIVRRGVAALLDDEDDVTAIGQASLLAGAAGYVIKDILVSAIRTIGSGRSLLDNRAAAVLMESLRAGVEKPGPLADLTDQERAVLDLIGEGLTNRQIAGRMFLSEKTIKNYVSSLLSKLGMERRTQAAVLVTGGKDVSLPMNEKRL